MEKVRGVAVSLAPLSVASISNDKVEVGEPGARCEMSFILRCHLILAFLLPVNKSAQLHSTRQSQVLSSRNCSGEACMCKPIKASDVSGSRCICKARESILLGEFAPSANTIFCLYGDFYGC